MKVVIIDNLFCMLYNGKIPLSSPCLLERVCKHGSVIQVHILNGNIIAFGINVKWDKPLSKKGSWPHVCMHVYVYFHMCMCICVCMYVYAYCSQYGLIPITLRC